MHIAGTYSETNLIEMIKILITDDHPILRQGVRQILEDDPQKRFLEIDECGTAGELMNKILKNDYDVLILDISLPGKSGLEIIQEVRKMRPDLRILVLSIYPEDQYAYRAIRLGASGYLTKTSAPEMLITAVSRIASGGRFLTPEAAENLLFNMSGDDDKPLHDKLSPRELQVVTLLAKGKTVSSIASEMSLSPKTISTYRERILEKLRLTSTSDIIRYAIEEGIA